MQLVIKLSANTDDAPMIAIAKSAVSHMGAAFATTCAPSKISESSLFDRRWHPIDGTNPDRGLALSAR